MHFFSAAAFLTATRSAGVANLGIHDQRQALLWIQQNIAAFGGDKSNVTNWCQLAGAGSVGTHLITNSGRNDHLFRAAISESGGQIFLGPGYNRTLGQAYYNDVSAAVGCYAASDTLVCLRHALFDKLNAALNISYGRPSTYPYVDGSLIAGPRSTLLASGHFPHVTYLIGTNFDEAICPSARGIDTSADFRAEILSYGIDHATTATMELFYPNILAIGIPATFVERPPAKTPGLQLKVSSAFIGDISFQAMSRLVHEAQDK